VPGPRRLWRRRNWQRWAIRQTVSELIDFDQPTTNDQLAVNDGAADADPTDSDATVVETSARGGVSGRDLPWMRTVRMLHVPHRRLLTCAAATALVVLLIGVWAPGALDAALAEALRRNDVGLAELDRPTPGNPVSFIVVGSDRREGMPRDIAALGHVTGERADVVMVWLIDARARTIRVVSLSRYLRVNVHDHGTQMLAGAREYGAPALVDATRSLVGIPIHHYVELDFAALHELVEAAGGVTLTIAKQARDQVTSLDLPSGEQQLGGDEVLAYLRSRHYEELRDGRWVPVETGDDGRIGRQHRVIHALLRRIAELDDPVAMAQVLLAVARHVTVDKTMRASELAELRQILIDDPTLRTDNLPTQLEVPAAEAISPFPPAHIGNIGYRLPSGPAATHLLRDLVSGASILEEEGG
jgi:LCP family protein required for cell wall assembly